ncbi:MAG: expansin EXLX1 family cellulose-binding protein [Cytophagales bacterium]
MKTLTIIIILISLLRVGAQQTCGSETVYAGEGTYYDINAFGGFGNCSFPNSLFTPFYIGAMNASQYGLAVYCGACAEVTGPKGKVIVTIIDQCPECKQGDIDLSPEAFDQIANRIDGRVKISWKIVSCASASPVQFYIKEGSSQYWTAVQVRNHKNKLEKFEYWNGTSYVALPRQDYNYFLASSGLGAGPYKFRLTDVYGNQIVEDNIPLKITSVLNGSKQFPACIATELENEDILLNESLQIEKTVLKAQKTQYLTLISSSGHLVYNTIFQENSSLKLLPGMYVLKSIVDEHVLVRKIYLTD